MENNNYINKYGKTLAELTWFTLKPAEDPLDIMKNEPMVKETRIEEKPKEKPPTFIPNEIMRNILSFLPPPVIKPKPYSIMNLEENENNKYIGYFCIIKRITKSGKFVVYDKYKFTDRDNYGYFTICQDCRSKLYKDKEKRCYYIKNNGDRYNLDNKLVKRDQFINGIDTRIFMTTPQYIKLIREEYLWIDAPVSTDLLVL